MYICICSPPGFSEVCVICTFVFVHPQVLVRFVLYVHLYLFTPRF